MQPAIISQPGSQSVLQPARGSMPCAAAVQLQGRSPQSPGRIAARWLQWARGGTLLPPMARRLLHVLLSPLTPRIARLHPANCM